MSIRFVSPAIWPSLTSSSLSSTRSHSNNTRQSLDKTPICSWQRDNTEIHSISLSIIYAEIQNYSRKFMPHGDDDEDEYEHTRMWEVWNRTGSSYKTILLLKFMSLKVTAQSCKWVDLLFRWWRLQIILIRLSPSMHLWCRLIWNFPRLIWILIKCVYLRKWMKWKINWVNEITFKLDRWWGVTRTRADTNFIFSAVGLNAGGVRRGNPVVVQSYKNISQEMRRTRDVLNERNMRYKTRHQKAWTKLNDIIIIQPDMNTFDMWIDSWLIGWGTELDPRQSGFTLFSLVSRMYYNLNIFILFAVMLNMIRYFPSLNPSLSLI